MFKAREQGPVISTGISNPNKGGTVMPAGIYEHDSMFSVREKPWHGLGVILKKHPKNIDQAVKAAGLDWQVVQRPVYALVDGDPESGKNLVVDPVEGYFVNIRQDTNQPLGIVTSRYQPVQNQEAFSFLGNLFGSEMHFETAGSLMNGRRVWVLMKLPNWVEVGGDAVAAYAFISNSHDGKSSVLLSCTPVRIVCENTLTAAVRIAKAAQRTYTIRHLGNMSQKISEARQALEVTVNYYEQFKALGDKLALAKLSEKRARSLTERLLPIEEGMGDRAAANREEARDTIIRLFKEGTIVKADDGTELSTVPENAPKTVWAFYNAATEYADWYRGERKEGGRFQRAIDDPDGFKNNAWTASLEAAGV
jgi:phage/plasmid-like protein (TIGR03299 family)